MEFQRTLAKSNYKIHTRDQGSPHPATHHTATINAFMPPRPICECGACLGLTAAHGGNTTGLKPANMREFATLEQLVVLSNLESHQCCADPSRTGVIGAPDAIETVSPSPDALTTERHLHQTTRKSDHKQKGTQAND